MYWAPRMGSAWRVSGLFPAPHILLRPLPSPVLPHKSLAKGSPALAQKQQGGPWLSRGCSQPGCFPSRIHAEFQLSEPPDFPFWFSPGQFTGHIILSKDATHIRDFRLFVPNHRWES